MRDFRNKPFPVAARVVYYDGNLEVSFVYWLRSSDQITSDCVLAARLIRKILKK